MWDIERIAKELRGLSDDALFLRTVEAIRISHDALTSDGELQQIDKAWRNQAWLEWTRRGKAERYGDALDAVREELRRRREINRI